MVKTNPVYGRRVNSFVSVLVFHHTDTSLYLLSLALALSIHNKLFVWTVGHCQGPGGAPSKVILDFYSVKCLVR